MSDPSGTPRDPPIPGDIPPAPPLAGAPAPPLVDRAAEEAARVETERLESVRLQDAINLIATHYNAQGGPPSQRIISPNRRLGNAPMLPPRVMGGNPAPVPAQAGGQAYQPGLLEQLNINPGRAVDGGVDRRHVNSTDSNTLEGKYEIFRELPADLMSLAQYNPSSTEMTFQKLRWAYTGQEAFEDYAHRMGSQARALGVGDVCFKNVLYQSIQPPCAVLCSDMEPSNPLFIYMNKGEYAAAINDRLEPRGARDLIYQQFLERVQKPSEIFDLYLRDKFNLFKRSYPEGQSRIFKDYLESCIRGLHNDILRLKVRDYLANQVLSGRPVQDFESFRSLVQVAVESITNRALAGELDAAETTGTSIQLMNFSYCDSTDAALAKGTLPKNRYKINNVSGGIPSDTEEFDINEFKQYQRWNKYKKTSTREATKDDTCYNCSKTGHFARNCPRNIFSKGNGGVHQVGVTNVPDLPASSDSEDTSSDEDPQVNYVKNTKMRTNPKKYQYPKRKTMNKDKMHAVETQIAYLSKQLADITAHLAPNPSGSGANASSVNVVEFPIDIVDINKEPETDFFHFL